jgi:pimeloyl-ACP methyl ester carboxylesterase
VITHGSGQDIDRYGTLASKSLFGWQTVPIANPVCQFVTRTGPFQIYRELAVWLADAHGIATLIYDKRGCTAGPTCTYLSCNSSVTTNCFNISRIGLDDLIADAQAAANYLKTRSDVRSSDITLVGHSQGCTVGSTVANLVSARRLIRLCGVGTDFFTFSYRQFAANAQTDLATQGYCDASIPAQAGARDFVLANVYPGDAANFNLSLVHFPQLERGVTNPTAPAPTNQPVEMSLQWRAKSDLTYELGQLRTFTSSGGRVLLLNSKVDVTVQPSDYLPLLFAVVTG